MKYSIKKIDGLWRVITEPSGTIWFSSSSKANCRDWITNCLMPQEQAAQNKKKTVAQLIFSCNNVFTVKQGSNQTNQNSTG